MNDKNFMVKAEVQAKEKSKKFWTGFGFVALSLGLAVLTVFILFLNM